MAERLEIPVRKWGAFQGWLYDNPGEAALLRVVGNEPYAWMFIEASNPGLAIMLVTLFDARWRAEVESPPPRS
jgi:hypothetical protein